MCQPSPGPVQQALQAEGFITPAERREAYIMTASTLAQNIQRIHNNLVVHQGSRNPALLVEHNRIQPLLAELIALLGAGWAANDADARQQRQAPDPAGPGEE